MGFLGPFWSVLGVLLGALGPLLGLSWAILEAIDQKRGRFLFPPPPRGPKNRLLGPSWGALGALLGALGAVLGLSWASLGAVLGHLGAILRPQEPIGSEKARRQTTLRACVYAHVSMRACACFGSSAHFSNRELFSLYPISKSSYAKQVHETQEGSLAKEFT